MKTRRKGLLYSVVRLFLLICCCAGLFNGAHAEKIPAKMQPASSGDAPRVVKFGMYITNLYDINFAKNQYVVDFWAWFLHHDRDYHPTKRTEIVNSKSFSFRNPDTEKEAGEYWVSANFRAVVNQQWDVRLFPFDTQHLTIDLEDTIDNSKYLHFVPDVTGSSISPQAIPAGWKLKDFSIKVRNQPYATTFGDPSVAPGTRYDFQRIVATVTLKREGLRIFASTFLGFFVATLLVIIVFSIIMSPRARSVVPVQTPTTLCLGALFAAVGGINGLNAKLPYTTQFTLADSIQIATFTGIVLAIIGITLAYVSAKSDYERIASRGIKVVFVLFLLAQFGVNGFLLIKAAMM